MEPSAARRRYNAEFEGDTMRRALIAVLAVFLATSVQAHAQLFTSQPAGTPAERVLIDTTVFVEPPDGPGLCMPLGAGQLTVTVKRTSDPLERRPTAFTLSGYQDDPEVNIVIPLGSQAVTDTKHVNGSYHYCWWIEMQAPETETMSHAARGAYAHTVDVRIVHRPD